MRVVCFAGLAVFVVVGCSSGSPGGTPPDAATPEGGGADSSSADSGTVDTGSTEAGGGGDAEGGASAACDPTHSLITATHNGMTASTMGMLWQASAVSSGPGGTTAGAQLDEGQSLDASGCLNSMVPFGTLGFAFGLTGNCTVVAGQTLPLAPPTMSACVALGISLYVGSASAPQLVYLPDGSSTAPYTGSVTITSYIPADRATGKGGVIGISFSSDATVPVLVPGGAQVSVPIAGTACGISVGGSCG